MARVFVYGDNVDTDVIIPARYLNTADMSTLAAHCMEDIDPAFASAVKPGDLIAAGHNFGCGSSREHAPAVLLACGIRAVIVRSPARIFYRNAINIGLPIFECEHSIEEGDEVTVDIAQGVVFNITKNERIQAAAFPPLLRDIYRKGGLLRALK